MIFQSCYIGVINGIRRRQAKQNIPELFRIDHIEQFRAFNVVLEYPKDPLNLSFLFLE